MNETMLSASNAEQSADTDSTIQQFFAEIDQSLAQMKQDQIEIETLRTETRLLQAETETMLTTLKGMF